MAAILVKATRVSVLGATVWRVSGNNSALALVEALGPSLVLLLAVLLASSLARKAGQFRNLTPTARVGGDPIQSGRQPPDKLEAALNEAAALNSFNVHDRSDPSVRLKTVARFAPSEFQSAVGEIATTFRDREVVSIDLAHLNVEQAVRVVDFCSGMAVMCSGWIFRITDKVIVLTPPA